MKKTKGDSIYCPLLVPEQAFLLAIKCKMSVHIGEGVSWVENQDGTFVSVEHEGIGDVAATCKAIALAATNETKL